MDEQGFWGRLGDGLAVGGRAIGRAAAATGRAVADVYLSIDPDLRRTLAELPLLGLSSLARAGSAPVSLPDDGHRPLVLVHGLGGGPGNFLALRAYLRLHGRRRVYAVSLPASEGILEMAARLSGYVAAVAAACALAHDARVDVVAHSMGGVVARLALDEPATAARVGTLVTLGSPHEGTHLARLARTPNTLSLRPGSELCARLRAQLPWPGPPTRPRLVSLWSTGDLVLLPDASAQVDGGENIEVPGLSHLEYLLLPAGWRAIERALAAPGVDASPPASGP